MDATWRLAEDPEQWLSRVARALSPVLDQGSGVQTLGVSFGAERHQLSTPVLHGGTSRWNTMWLENWWKPVVEPLDSPTFLAMLGQGPVCSAQQLWSRLPPQLPSLSLQLESLSDQGWSHAFRREPAPEPPRLFYVDSLNLFVHDRSSGEALCVVANRPDIVSPGELSRTRRTFSSIVSHLRVALRTRGRLRTQALLTQAEAIFAPDGAVLDASGSARRRAARVALRDAVCRLERARTAKTDTQVDDALRLWPQLTSGRWSIIDAFDTDGRRYLVAVPNEEAPSLSALSPREEEVVRAVAEGQSNKEIAWKLGRSTSTVATFISRGCRKLGVTSRAQLVSLVRSVD